MDDVVLASVPHVDTEIARLAARYRGAGGLGIDVLNAIGAQADGLLDRLPAPVRTQLDAATVAALTEAARLASSTRRAVPDQKPWVNRAVSAAMGAAGGFGGLPSALAELPVTTTLLLRVIEAEAAALGFDTAAENVRIDCIQVFAAAGPLEHDDSADLAFLSTRMALSGAAMQALIARVAPRLSVVLGQKLAAQTVPVLGAVAGAAVNYAYTRYYAEMSHVHFSLRRLAIDADLPPEAALRLLRAAL
ncbi:MAG: EcsC family protein [Pseudomonadota bacterium]